MRRSSVLLVLVVLCVVVPPTGSRPLGAQEELGSGLFNLTSFCTPTEQFPAFRSFRVTNSSGVTTRAELRNQSIGQSIFVDAPPGASFWDVPAGPGTNTVILLVDGQQESVKASNNNVCTALAGNAVCDPAAGQTTITWSVKNNDTGAAAIAASSPALGFAPDPIPAGGTATATQVIAGPATEQVVTQSVTLDLGRGVVSGDDETLTLGPCFQPIPPPLSFTFTKTPNVASAQVGETVTYTYAGTNTSQIPLEVTIVVDDRLGIVIQRPEVTLVQPGESISESVTYVVETEDAGTTIDNTAIVEVRDPAAPENAGVGVATASVAVPELPVPPDPEPEPGPGTGPGATTPPGGVGPTLPATGRAMQVAWAGGALLVGAGLLVVAATRRRPTP